ncbi:MAG: peptidoglycan bridge formation glycyltransferase FemA/FemB family protein [Candidatus Saccharibacteria bacterium]|nr:peptidoglycan bridge formation glycyltransferase FemA/FemB family protein [Candidatus Saccharibacteria bacterium]
MIIDGNFLQTKEWAEVSKKLGHKVYFENDVLMIVKDAKRGRYLEIPGGPLIDWENEEEKSKIFARIREIAKKENCVFVRFRPQLIDTKENRKLLPKYAKPAPFHLYAQNTIIIDLEKSVEDLMASMRRQTRYEVRRVPKVGLEVKKGYTDADFKEFHEIQVETARKKGFIPPTDKELTAYHEVFKSKAVIYKALVGQSVVATGLMIKSGKEVDYFEAASTDLNNKLPGSYGVLWTAIQDAKENGYKRFNLWGVAPPDPKNPGKYLQNHRYSKVTTFKTGFGGEQIDFIPAHDIVINSFRYNITKIIEIARKKWRHLG